MTKSSCLCLRTSGLPRREGGRGTEITTLPGGQNLGEITDIEYFKKKLTGPLMFRRRVWTEKVDLIWVDHLKSLGMS